MSVRNDVCACDFSAPCPLTFRVWVCAWTAKPTHMKTGELTKLVQQIRIGMPATSSIYWSVVETLIFKPTHPWFLSLFFLLEDCILAVCRKDQTPIAFHPKLTLYISLTDRMYSRYPHNTCLSSFCLRLSDHQRPPPRQRTHFYWAQQGLRLAFGGSGPWQKGRRSSGRNSRRFAGSDESTAFLNHPGENRIGRLPPSLPPSQNHHNHMEITGTGWCRRTLGAGPRAAAGTEPPGDGLPLALREAVDGRRGCERTHGYETLHLSFKPFRGP